MPDIPAGKERTDENEIHRSSRVVGRRRFPLFFSRKSRNERKGNAAPPLAVALFLENSDRFDRAASWRRLSRSTKLEKASIGPQGRHLCQRGSCEKVLLLPHRVVADLSRFSLNFPKSKKTTKKTGIDIGGSDDGLPTGPQQLSAPSSREARGGNVSAVASRLKPSFLKGQRAYLVATSCHLPPKEDFVHKTFLINAIRKSVSVGCRGHTRKGSERECCGGRRKRAVRGTRKLIERLPYLVASPPKKGAPEISPRPNFDTRAPRLPPFFGRGCREVPAMTPSRGRGSKSESERGERREGKRGRCELAKSAELPSGGQERLVSVANQETHPKNSKTKTKKKLRATSTRSRSPSWRRSSTPPASPKR